ncbi:phospholipid carrier-dependent glycosyltransferase [Novosphingobium album (ex Hu et al. 2023)]|uniref:Polyprenol-phosphate-mannose--protein mannosyltransferase n=1 Tax=Novosphingobium album (ex Hu et al. 2023) TaxID=2930093 RepID=A0ABT0B635_9SPHN|nr:phospholipid carrier-dependent glycosyltransferase [Novosphingobium album (ex Hu et al. 2023)]MCJ2180537.1 phospholipid carrier-dependent glycosyltransferase [Novosphingobium album (ex Hu et al. 2023)]
MRRLAFWTVAALAGFLLGWRIDAVNGPIWDESYYVTAEARVHQGQLQFASHPPLGILLMAGGDAASGLNRDVNWRKIAAAKSIRGQDMPPGFDWRGPRLAPVIFGALSAGLFFLLMADLTGSTGAGLLMTPLFVCDPALLAQFRAGQLDAFQLAFVLASLICAVKALRRDGVQARAWAAGFGAALMLAAMVRANALVLAPLGLLLTVPCLRRRYWGGAIACVGAGAGAAILAASWVLAVMLMVSPLPPDVSTEAGRIDAAYVKHDYARENLFAAITSYGLDYAAFMRADLDGMARTDTNASHPVQWLLGGGAITYRWDASDRHVSAVALVPNRVAWLVSLAGVLWALAVSVVRRGRNLRDDPAAGLLLGGWLLSMAALVWLDGQRVMYLYHYFIPLVLGYGLAARAWRGMSCSDRMTWPILAALTGYAMFALPLALHQPVSREHCRLLLGDCGQTRQD